MNVRGLTYYCDDIKANIKADTILFDIRIGSDGQRTDLLWGHSLIGIGITFITTCLHFDDNKCAFIYGYNI